MRPEFTVTNAKNLYEDLKKGKMNTLEKYSVPWTHINIDKLKPIALLDHELLDKMWKEAAIGVHLQCSREYLEEDNECEVRATQLHKLTPEKCKCIPTENLKFERYLVRFHGLASVSAAKGNIFYKAKRIRDDLMLETKMATDKKIDVTTSTIKITNQLKKMERDWTTTQKST